MMPSKRMGCGALLIGTAVLLVGCGTSDVPEAGGVSASEALLVGADQVIVTPSDAQIAGIEEARGALRRSVVQRFHLGGFGLGPFEVLPPAVNNLFANDPAGAPVLHGDLGPEHTWLRTLVISSPPSGDTADNSVVFITVDAVGAGNVIQDGLAAAITERTGIPRQRILFSQTHTHAGADLQGLWGGVPQQWIDNDDPQQPGLYQRAAASVARALEARQPAELRAADILAPEFNSYRRARILGSEAADPLLNVLQARNLVDGTVIGSIVQYSAHPTNVGAGENPRIPHPDYIVGVTAYMDEQYGGTTLYFNGPIADASNKGPEAENRYTRARLRGMEIARKAQEALESEGSVLAPELTFRHADAVLPVLNPLFIALGALFVFDGYYNFSVIPPPERSGLLGEILDAVPLLGELINVLPLVGAGDFGNFPLLAEIPGIGALLAEVDQLLPQLALTTTTQVSRVSIGNSNGNGLEIVTIPGEATNTFGQELRELMRSRHRMLLGLTHNSFGYIVPMDEYAIGELLAGEFPYEETVGLGPLTAPLLMAQAYYPLFDIGVRDRPPGPLTGCIEEPGEPTCLLTRLVTYLRNSVLTGGIEGDNAEAAPLSTRLGALLSE